MFGSKTTRPAHRNEDARGTTSYPRLNTSCGHPASLSKGADGLPSTHQVTSERYYQCLDCYLVSR
jgi:hypothetical protein